MSAVIRPRIAIAGFQHETNTFAPFPTAMRDFEHSGAFPDLCFGDDVLQTLTGLNLPLGGFIDAGDDLDIIPILWTFAEPGGPVTGDAFDRISGMILDGIEKAGTIDGIYLDLHGAMVTDSHDDGEAELLRRVRDQVGPDLPIAVSFDLHGNLSRGIFERASVTTIYRTYPHVDMAQTGARARALLVEELRRGEPFKRAYRQLDYLIPIQSQSTRREPGNQLYGLLQDLAGDGVASVDFAFGFPPADIPDCGASIFAYGDDQAAVDAAADRMLGMLQEAEGGFRNPLKPAEETVAEAKRIAVTASKPVIIADPQDNPGAGATGETTGLLRALVEGGARQAVIGLIWDAAAAGTAHEAGIGGEFDVAIGGRYAPSAPYPARVQVIALSDGHFTYTGPMYRDVRARLGDIAALKIIDENSDVTVLVGAVRTQNADQAIFTHIGIDPTQQKIVAVKSAAHFLADYEPIAETVLFAESPGANPCQLDTIAYTKLRPGVRLGPNGPAFAAGKCRDGEIEA